MSYKRADKVLPDELLKLIWQYVDGDYLYIPRKSNCRKGWGENTSTKEDLSKRNTAIYQDFTCGVSINELAEKYYLSLKSIERIVYGKRKNVF